MCHWLFVLLALCSTSMPHEDDGVSEILLSFDNGINHGIWRQIALVAALEKIKITVSVKDKVPSHIFDGIDGVDIRVTPYVDSMWIRDYGPIEYFNDIGEVSYANALDDNNFTRALADERGIHYTRLNIEFEGGNLASNGRGVCIMSDKVLREGFYLPLPEEHKIILLKETMARIGCQNVLLVTQLLTGTGDVDMYMMWVHPNKLVVGIYSDDQHHQNHIIMTENAAYLKANGIDVHVVDMEYTYLNMILLNHHAIVPIYAHVNQTIMREIASLVAPRKVVTIIADELVDGGIHSIVRTLSKRYDRILQTIRPGDLGVISTRQKE